MAPLRDRTNKAGNKLIASNRRARRDYDIIDAFETGIVLSGSEVKALREGHAQVADAYARIINGQVWLDGVHIPPYQFAHGVGAHDPGVIELVGTATDHGWSLDPEKVTCPVRIVWGTEDRILAYPRTAARFRNSWLPNADWVELEGVGHCPQLDVPAETAQLILGFTDN